MLKGKKKAENTEIDLVAFISLLSVCICFLLLTTIWIQIGSMSVKQAIGGQSIEKEKPKPSLWVVYEKEGGLRFQLQNSTSKLRKKIKKIQINGVEGKPDLESLRSAIADMKSSVSGLAMALIRPHAETPFEDIIGVMDLFRDMEFQDLGVTPI